MKRTLFFLLIIAMAACARVDAPQLALEIPDLVKEDTTQKEYLTSLQTYVNQFALKCARMSRDAEKYRGKIFTEMSEKQQKAMVKLDLDYVTAWYDMNVQLFDATMQLTKMASDDVSAMELYAATNGCLMEVNRFVEALATQYGQDLKLDTTSPFYREVPDRPQTPTIEMPSVQDSTAQ